MRIRYHIPTYMQFQGEASENEKARLEQALIAAIRRAVEGAATGSAEMVTADEAGIQEDTREHFSLTRYFPDRNTYTIPSFQQGGPPTEDLPVEKIIFEEEEVEEVTSAIHLRPAGEVSEDRVISGRSPFEGKLIAIFPRWEAIRVRSERYAVVSDLRRAIRWGQYLFGARSFVIIEGPFGSPESRYNVMGTTNALRPKGGSRHGIRVTGGHEVSGLAGRIHWETEFRDGEGRLYLFRSLFTVDDRPIFPPNIQIANEFYTELAVIPRERGVIPTELARSLVFNEINTLISAGSTGEAAQRLARLDANAFALVDWETKARYLQVLIDVWTNEPEEVAIVEMIKSIVNRSELFAIIGILRQARLYDQLFNDLDSHIWKLLTVVGQRFGDQDPVTFEFFVEVLRDAGLVPGNLGDIATRITLGPAGLVISPDFLAEVEEAARGFIRFLGGTLEAIWMLISEPEKVVEGVSQLVKLITMVQLAQLGYPPAVEYVGNILRQMSQQVVYGLKGARLLGITGNIVRRIKWAIVWEVASWFVGVGEIRAILAGVGITERVAALARITRILGLVGRGTEAERIAGKFQSLARIMGRSSRVIGQEDEFLRLLSHLPEGDVNHLSRALEAVDIDETIDIARLAQLQPELGAIASDTLNRVEALSEFATKAGGLSDTVIEAFARLAGRDRLISSELSDLIRLVPEGEGARFARAVKAIPESALGPGGFASSDFLRMVAGSPRRMNTLANMGYNSFAAIYRRTGRNVGTLDQYLDALVDLERRFPLDTRATEYRQLIDRLERGETRAWIGLEDARRARVGGERLQGLQQVIVGNPGAEAGFDRLLRGRHNNVIDDLMEDVLPNNTALARRRFEQVGNLTDEQAEGLAVIQRLDDTGDIGLRTTWGEVLDLDSAWRGDVLELTAQVHRFVDDGLDLALKRGLQGPGSNVQGALGHLYAARTLQQQFPGARFKFEVPGPNREIDIQVSVGGRQIDVEVKTNLGLEPTISSRQIRRDIIRHIDDQFQDMLYLYAPQQAGNLHRVEDGMLRALQHTSVRAALQQRGISIATAENWLRHRFAQGMVGIFNY
ncbi:MAG: hypothetical protein GY774_20885 [Planctomycetes bacterium]|nr:hypothetical protein [Planctomycetota bacterium]